MIPTIGGTLAEVTLSSALTDASSVVSSVVSIITGNAVLMAMFAAGLLTVGAKVFKRIKNSVK